MGQIFSNISLKSRLSLLLVLVTLASSFLIGLLAWSNGRAALNQSITNQLTSIRAAQAFHIESYFKQVFSHTRTLAEDRMIVNAMKQFKAGFEVGLYRQIGDPENALVSNYYTSEFASKLAENLEDPPLSIMFRPKRAGTNYFQYHSLVENPFPAGEKDLMTSSEKDATIYSKFHTFYHPILRNITSEFGFYDLFLIDLKSLTINYSVFKETDFGTSLLDGPYKDSGLGVLAGRIKDTPARGDVMVTDFRSYFPSYGAPAAFVGAPIYDGNDAIGILAMQLPTDEINRVMTYNERWSENGLGDTGETYLVGADRTMRSDARLLIEDQDQFFEKMDEVGYLPATVKLALSLKTSSTLIPVTGSSASRAFERESGTHLAKNYFGDEVLSSFAPLNIPGLEWAIISEISASEAFRPIGDLQRSISIWGVVLILIVALLSMLVSRYFVSPIEKLADGISALSSGSDDVVVDIQSKDEFGELATSFNDMVANIREKSATIERKTAENKKLLLNILPEPIAARYQDGEQIADQLQQVSIAYLQFVGLNELSDKLGAKTAAEYLHELVDQLDELSDGFEVEKVRTLGSTYIAACGLNHARLDHSRQLVEFSVMAHKTLTRFNAKRSVDLNLKIGVASGPVTSAVVGRRQFQYELWGAGADLAARIRFEAEPGEIIVTEDVMQKLNGAHRFSAQKNLILDGNELQLFSIELASADAALKA